MPHLFSACTSPRASRHGFSIRLIGLLILTCAIISCGGQDDAASKYNVLLITLDTTRADRLSCYGYPKITSPHLDALAEDGVLFDMAISTAAVTPISHASILTGLNPHRHGLRVFFGDTGHFLESDFPTITTVLKDHGWQTGAFISAYPASERFGMHWGFDVFRTDVADNVMTQDPAKLLPKDGFCMNKPVASAQRRADPTTDQALMWLKKVERPFFTWLHYFDPHDPSLVPPNKYMKKFGIKSGQKLAIEDLYDPEIFFMDKHIGRVIEYLKETGEYDNTVIIAIGDHGQGMGQHDWFAHRLLYQEQIRLPFIMRIPEGARGMKIPDLVRSIDVMPTILEAVGLKPPKPIEGSSLIGMTEGRSGKPRLALAEALNTVDLHAPEHLPEHQQDDLFCMMDGRWKLIYHKHNPENNELYDLQADPAELKNVAADHPDEVARLKKALDKSGALEVKFIEPGAPMDQEALEKLRSLGYGGGR